MTQSGNTPGMQRSGENGSHVTNWEVGAQATWNVFEWGTTYYADKQAGWQVTKMRYEQENLKLEVGYDIKSKYLAVQEARKRIAVAQNSVAQATEAYNVALARYHEHVGTNFDVLDASANLTSAQSSLTGAKADYLTALSQIYVAMGEYHPRPAAGRWRRQKKNRRSRMSDSEQFLTVTPLGGLGEIGLNCQLWETSAGVVMVDCGLMFPDDFHLGVDVVIPHFGAVSAVRDKLLGIVLTHGHEDHIGALPWLVPQLRGTRIYGSYFTLALVEHKLREHELLDWVELCPVEPGDQVAPGRHDLPFLPRVPFHPRGFGLGVETPVGRIVHSGDFKIDPQPLAGSGTDLATFRDFAGPEGARLLFSDSTNVERDGRSLTERAVMESLGKVFDEAPGRIVVTLFSSHIQRIQEVFDLARERGRTVVISGKSWPTISRWPAILASPSCRPAFSTPITACPTCPTSSWCWW